MGVPIEGIERRLESELRLTIERIRQLGEFEQFRGAMADVTLLNEVDGDREMSFATRSLLVEKANRLAGALARLREGRYGICEECGEAIAPGRLRVMPEATTCVRCQDRLDRLSRRLETVEVGFGGEG